MPSPTRVPFICNLYLVFGGSSIKNIINSIGSRPHIFFIIYRILFWSLQVILYYELLDFQHCGGGGGGAGPACKGRGSRRVTVYSKSCNLAQFNSKSCNSSPKIGTQQILFPEIVSSRKKKIFLFCCNKKFFFFFSQQLFL